MVFATSLTILVATPRATAPVNEAVVTPPRLSDMTVRTDDDHPVQALRLRQSGMTRVSLGIDRRGRVATCDIVERSGAPVLDTATCKTMAKWRFTPARAAGGKAVDGELVRTMRWMLPGA